MCLLCWYSPLKYTAILIPVTVEFEQAVYTVMEDAESAQVCVLVSGKKATEELLITLYTEENTAHGIVF